MRFKVIDTDINAIDFKREYCSFSVAVENGIKYQLYKNRYDNTCVAVAVNDPAAAAAIFYSKNVHNGSATINLLQFFPCKRDDFKRLCSIINIAVDPAGSANQIYNFIVSVINSLVKERNTYDTNTEYGKKHISLCNADIRKYSDYIAILNKECCFSFDIPAADIPDKIKTKNCVCYAVIFNSVKHENELQLFNGFQFSKNGIVFKAFKRDKRSQYTIILAGTGVAVCNTSSKAAVIDAINERVFTLLTDSKNREKLVYFRNVFTDLMLNSGYTDSIINQPLFNTGADSVSVPAVTPAVAAPAAVDDPGAAGEIVPAVTPAVAAPAAVDDPGAAGEKWYLQRIIIALLLDRLQPLVNTMQPFKKRSAAVFDTS